MPVQPSLSTASSAFSDLAVDDLDERIYQFDFDVFVSGGVQDETAGSLTFALLAVEDQPADLFPLLGDAGPGLGFARLRSVKHTTASFRSLGVEVDLWNSGVEYEAPGLPENERTFHVGIDSQDQVISVVQAHEGVPDPSTTDGIHVTVVYNRGEVSVRLAGNGPGAPGPPRVLETRLPPLTTELEEGHAFFGFTASTAETAHTIEVDNVVVSAIDCSDIQEVATILGTPEDPVEAGAVVVLDGSGSHGGLGEEAAEPVVHFWEVISGEAEMLGPDWGPTVNVQPTGAGAVVVRLTVDDGNCDNGGVGRDLVRRRGALRPELGALRLQR